MRAPAGIGPSAAEVASLLEDLRQTLDALRFPLDLPQAPDAREEAVDLRHQLDDYILPRYASLDAPLLTVVGGSTGSGKSALVNALVGRSVAQSSAIRPTTRTPLLVHHPDDRRWFDGPRILPELARVRGRGGDSHTELGLAEADTLPPGLALLDSPDIDSIVEDNRRLAAQLLSAADLWLFVTTAARYADAIPWAMLDEAAARNIVVAIVLNRVPSGVGAEVRSDLARRLTERNLDHAPLFVIGESDLGEGLIPEPDVAGIRAWLEGLAHDSSARTAVARQTLGGAVDGVTARGQTLLPALDEQRSALFTLASQVDDAFAQAHAKVVSAVDDGSVLRGEVLSRWQDFVGSGEILRQVEAGVGKVRDRIAAWFRGDTQAQAEQVEEAIEDGIARMLIGETESAIATVERAWARGLGGERLVSNAAERLRSHEERVEAATTLVRQWQADLTDLIREEGKDKRAAARVLSLGVNTVGIALMIVIFASTAGLTGGEVVVAGGTAVVAQKLLEAIFGDEAVRRMAQSAQKNLGRRAGEFMVDDAEPFRDELATLGVDASAGENLGEILALLTAARRGEQGE
ncbi:dynamin family protein [Flaviflexus equikiangi]|uniref:dynamin family protein n=1 Tax=Flaviflexus equikiangi TaxID=2758573 RepID=UPI0015F60816|nr:GTPase domain-containing protein [Flaviflexus equikiangi]